MIPNLGTITTTHVGHKRFLKASLSCLEVLNSKVKVCSYNTNNGYLGWPTLTPILPDNDVMEMADRWIFSSDNTHIGSWGWLHLAGIAILANFETDYIFSLEGDCVMTKPEGVEILYERLLKEDGDIICAERQGPTHAGVVSYLAKTGVALAAIKELMTQRNNISLGGSGPEGRFGAAINKLGIKCLDVKNPDTAHFSYGYRGTWGDILGFIHLHGTEKWRIGHHHKPLPEYLYDKRHLPPMELNALEKYWRTGDTSHLVTDGYWWPENEKIDNGEKEMGEI